MKKILFMAVIFLITQPVHALSCVESSLEESFKQSDYIFVGRVEAMTEGQRTGNMDHPVWLTVVIQEIFKTENARGPLAADKVRVKINAYWGNTFSEGREYLFYAKREGETVVNPLCSRTKPVEDVKDDLQRLRSENLGGLYAPESHSR